ncbi:hypothetical protein B566_EDAN016451, partial [Ephemera danica]
MHHQSNLSEKLEGIGINVATLEEQLSSLPNDNLDNMREKISATINLENAEEEFLASDEDSLPPSLTVSSLLAKISALRAESEIGIAAIDGAIAVQKNTELEFKEYEILLSDLGKWVHESIMWLSQKDWSLSAEVLEEKIKKCKNIQLELERKKEDLFSLKENCSKYRNNINLQHYTHNVDQHICDLFDSDTSAEVSMPLSASPSISIAATGHEDPEKIEIPSDTSLIVGTNLIIAGGESDVGSPDVDINFSTLISDRDDDSKLENEYKVGIFIDVSDTSDKSSVRSTMLNLNQTEEHVSESQHREISFEENDHDELSSKPLHLEPDIEENDARKHVLYGAVESMTESASIPDDPKKFVVKSSRKTLVSRELHQLATIQRTTTLVPSDGDIAVSPETNFAFSEIKFCSQHREHVSADGDANITFKEQQFGGHVSAGIPINPSSSTVPGVTTEKITYHTGDVIPSTIIATGNEIGEEHTQTSVYSPEISKQCFVDDDNIVTTTSNIKTVVQQLSKRTIKRTRKIIKRVVVIDGVDQVVEEILEDPEEVEITESSMPQMSIEIITFDDSQQLRETSQITSDIEQTGVVISEVADVPDTQHICDLQQTNVDTNVLPTASAITEITLTNIEAERNFDTVVSDLREPFSSDISSTHKVETQYSSNSLLPSFESVELNMSETSGHTPRPSSPDVKILTEHQNTASVSENDTGYDAEDKTLNDVSVTQSDLKKRRRRKKRRKLKSSDPEVDELFVSSAFTSDSPKQKEESEPNDTEEEKISSLDDSSSSCFVKNPASEGLVEDLSKSILLNETNDLSISETLVSGSQEKHAVSQDHTMDVTLSEFESYTDEKQLSCPPELVSSESIMTIDGQVQATALPENLPRNITCTSVQTSPVCIRDAETSTSDRSLEIQVHTVIEFESDSGDLVEKLNTKITEIASKPPMSISAEVTELSTPTTLKTPPLTIGASLTPTNIVKKTDASVSVQVTVLPQIYTEQLVTDSGFRENVDLPDTPAENLVEAEIPHELTFGNNSAASEEKLKEENDVPHTDDFCKTEMDPIVMKAKTDDVVADEPNFVSESYSNETSKSNLDGSTVILIKTLVHEGSVENIPRPITQTETQTSLCTISQEPQESRKRKKKSKKRINDLGQSTQSSTPDCPKIEIFGDTNESLPSNDGLEQATLDSVQVLTEDVDKNEPIPIIGIASSSCRQPLHSVVDQTVHVIPLVEEPSELQSQIAWKHAGTQVAERLRNLQNAQKTSKHPGLSYTATLHQAFPVEALETRSICLQQNLSHLSSAIELNDHITLQRTVIAIVESVSTWLETIEYRVYLNHQTSTSAEQVQEFTNLRNEMDLADQGLESLKITLHSSTNSLNELTQSEIQKILGSLEEQLKSVNKITCEGEMVASKNMIRWEEFLKGINDITTLVDQEKRNFDLLQQSDTSPQSKLHKLEQIANTNKCLIMKLSQMLSSGRFLFKEFPGHRIPPEIYNTSEIARSLEISINSERERLLQLLSLADEYEQTIEELSQIIDIADTIVHSPIIVNSREELQQEMQKHRKFFANLSHCQQLLESLDSKLDPETRQFHSELHTRLHSQASVILDKAAQMAQQMALAASRWTVLEQGMREEKGWLQVAQQRVPDLQSSLTADIAVHYARINQLTSVAHTLEGLITCYGLESTYNEYMDTIIRLQETVHSSLQQLLTFRDIWIRYENLSDKVEGWTREAEKNLKFITSQDLPAGNEMKAQFEVHNMSRGEAGVQMNQAFHVLPVSDEDLQRQFYSQLEERWRCIANQIAAIQATLRRSLSLENGPDKLVVLEKELKDIQNSLNDVHGIIKSEEDLLLYIERIQVLCQRCELLEDELGRLGPAAPGELQDVARLLGASRRLGLQLAEEREVAALLRDKFSALIKGLQRATANQLKLVEVLDSCEGGEDQSSELVEQALNNCLEVQGELGDEWQELMRLRQVLHSLPLSLRASVSPVGVEREMSALQADHAKLEERAAALLVRLRARQKLWRVFEQRLEAVQQCVHETDYMMELLAIKGGLDFDRLKVATERLEREELLGELKTAAQPLATSCAPEVRQRVESSVAAAESAWHETSGQLRSLCSRYQDAVQLWRRYQHAADALRIWADQQLATAPADLENNEPHEALACAKVRALAAEIASRVGLQAMPQDGLAGEVEALCQRLDDVRHAVATLAEAAQSRATEGELCSEDLQHTRTVLGNVQQ